MSVHGLLATSLLASGEAPTVLGLLAVGLVGFASTNGSPDPIDRLTTGVRQVESGNYDVDFPTDRDDDVGRLAVALEEMTASLRERERRQEQNEQYRKELYKITSDMSLDDGEKVERLLDLGCERLDIENGHVVRVDADTARHEVIYAAGSDLVEPNGTTDLEETYCRETIQREDILGVYNAPAQGWGGDPAYERWSINCYLGGKILVDDDLYGTLCFADRDIREEPFTHAERAFVDLLTRGLSHLFERREHERRLALERDRFSALFENSTAEVVRVELTDDDIVVRAVNQQFVDTFEYDEAEIVGEPLAEYTVPPDRQERVTELVRRARRGERFEHQVTRQTADGKREFVAQFVPIGDADSPREGYAVYRDITERVQRERELERVRELLDRSQRIASVGGWELDLTEEPPDLRLTDETYRIHDLPVDVDAGLEETVEFYHPDDRSRVRQAIQGARERGDAYDLEARLVTAEGDQRWVRSIGEPVTDDGEVVAIRGSVQDVTDQKERELALKSLHELSRELLGAETETAVADLVVGTAEEILDVTGVGVYRLDRGANQLEPAAVTEAFVECCPEIRPVPVGDGDSVLCNAYVSGIPTMFDDEDVRSFGGDVGGGMVVPVGDHGVFVAVDPTAAVDEETRRLVEMLGATIEAALDHLESEASLRERDAELETQNGRLRRQVQVNDIIRSIDRSLIGAESREAIESTVPERLVEAPDVAFAWVGEFDPTGTELVPRTWAGEGQAYLDAVSLTDAGVDVEPTVAAARSGTPVVVENVVERLQDASWPEHALAAGFDSVVCVPLVVDEFEYGVLSVYADEPGAFADLEREVFAELGENIANSIKSVQTRAALHGEALQELTLQFDGQDTFLARLAQVTGSRVAYEGLATHGDDETRLFFTTDADPDDVRGALEDLVVVRGSRLVDEADGQALFEATVTGEGLAATFVRHGASPTSIVTAGTELEAVLEVSRSVDVREFVEMLQDRHPDVELLGRQDVQRTAHTRQEVVAALFEALTDRQREVLRTAYHAGFFEWPRASTGEEVAEMLDVSQPTVNRHLRHGQQQLLTQLFDGDLSE